MTVDASGSANGAAAGGGRNNGTAPQCVVPRPAATTTTTTTTTFRRAGMPSPKEEGDDGLRRPPQRVTHSFNEEFFTMAALCLASAFAFFCCPIFMERPQQDRYEGAATTLPPTDQHWGVGQAASQQK
ncbi:uncharacterized protein LOC123512694 isoform X1 [Portunus trituberculatus]|uniref:uncharacterized protein LOC123512694 isoform X1 n=1 Tax=Portunus trituberculatus TaxID=210409 RepID=UPI001E1CE2BF|nr:uncharacterized protein LOC123512694 isoform X1 [Portunus trituberculatus]